MKLEKNESGEWREEHIKYILKTPNQCNLIPKIIMHRPKRYIQRQDGDRDRERDRHMQGRSNER